MFPSVFTQGLRHYNPCTPKYLEKPVELKINPDSVSRLRKYIESKHYRNFLPSTHHWEIRKDNNVKSFIFHSDKLYYRDLYTGMEDNYLENFGCFHNRMAPALRLKKYLLNKLGVYEGESFDPIYQFNKLWGNNGCFKLNDILRTYPKATSWVVIRSYAMFNEIHSFLDESGVSCHSLLEIGPGGGNLIRRFKEKYPTIKAYIIDLPTSIPFSFCNLVYHFGTAKYCLPNEIEDNVVPDADFVFLSDSQANFLPKKSIDIAINTMSFAEMRFETICEYFNILRKTLKENNIFYCLNRVEKIMEYDGKVVPIRFHEYPWKNEDKDYLFRISDINVRKMYHAFFVKITKLHVE